MTGQVDIKAQNFYATFVNLEAIKAFVRTQLGCQCEDEVFKQTVIGAPAIFPEDNPGWDLQILIGFRLLISLVPVLKLRSLDEDIRKMLQSGKNMRDRHGLNRFRLVLLGQLEKELYESCQKKAQQLDEKIHLHVIEL
jgi:hypothetical protein